MQLKAGEADYDVHLFHLNSTFLLGMPFVIPFRFSFEWKKTKPEMGEGGRHFEWEARVASLLLSFLSLFLLSRFFE